MINSQIKENKGIKEYIGTIISGIMLIVTLSSVLIVVGEQKSALASVSAKSVSHEVIINDIQKQLSALNTNIAVVINQQNTDAKKIDRIEKLLDGFNEKLSDQFHSSPFPKQNR